MNRGYGRGTNLSTKDLTPLLHHPRFRRNRRRGKIPLRCRRAFPIAVHSAPQPALRSGSSLKDLFGCWLELPEQ